MACKGSDMNIDSSVSDMTVTESVSSVATDMTVTESVSSIATTIIERAPANCVVEVIRTKCMAVNLPENCIAGFLWDSFTFITESAGNCSYTDKSRGYCFYTDESRGNCS
ncbi:hypothetical protein Bpfe_022276 [Biomphalaria pfeifferi]|uniref:Uncharacterized protein n=1 Tax=Biomphalaria pfeifferi TaxID=112525 RepID=A0AAD8F353_BIOPF|nr:hypothetical protein Bpfe_022276 [Biomphalaria pfeifferi]